MKSKERNDLIEKKAKEIACLVFEIEGMDQLIITGIKSKKMKYSKHGGFKVDGLCFKRRDIMKLTTQNMKDMNPIKLEGKDKVK